MAMGLSSPNLAGAAAATATKAISTNWINFKKNESINVRVLFVLRMMIKTRSTYEFHFCVWELKTLRFAVVAIEMDEQVCEFNRRIFLLIYLSPSTYEHSRWWVRTRRGGPMIVKGPPFEFWWVGVWPLLRFHVFNIFIMIPSCWDWLLAVPSFPFLSSHFISSWFLPTFRPCCYLVYVEKTTSQQKKEAEGLVTMQAQVENARVDGRKKGEEAT